MTSVGQTDQRTGGPERQAQGPPVRPSARPTPVIDVRGYSFRYGPAQALFDITLQIPRRAVTALIGPSGCGKTTFLRSINRLNDLIPGIRHEGDMTLDGQSIFDKSMDVVALRQRVG